VHRRLLSQATLKIIILKACVVLSLVGCFSNPSPQERREAFLAPTLSSSPHKDLALGVMLSENAKSAALYAQQYSQNYPSHTMAKTAAEQIFGNIFAMLSRQFKTVVKIDTVEDAQIKNLDLVAILDVYLEFPNPGNPEDKARMSLGTKFIGMDNTQIDVATVESVSTPDWSSRVADYIQFVSRDSIMKLEASIGSSQKLAELDKLGTRPSAVASTKTRPTKTLTTKSDVDNLSSITTRETRKNAYAIVVGIEQYREQLPKADFADRDASLMGEYLSMVLGYPEENIVVRTNENATKNDLEKYFEGWLPNNVEKDSSVFIYYSGHGAPNPKTGDAYLVPYDGDPTFVDKTGYPLKRLYAALDKLPAKEITVILDSCFSGAGGRSVLAEGARPMVLSVENTLLAHGKTVVLAASAGNQISSTFKEKGHGLLTYYFLKGLQGDGDTNKDGVIDMVELYEYVKPNVQKVARKQYNNEQTPQLLATPEVLRKGGGRLIERTIP